LASILREQLTPLENTVVDLITQQYSQLAIDQRDDLIQFQFTNNAPIYRAVKVACFELGFVEHDAQCIATAWQKKCLHVDDFKMTQWPSDLLDFDFKVSPLGAFPNCPKNLGLYVVAPTASWIEKLAKAGVKTLQLRFKSENQQAIDAEVKAAIEYVKPYPCHLFINDHWQAAIQYGAYGVHIGQEDLALADLSAIHLAGLRLGISSHGYQEMLLAAYHQPSYIALGAIFPTTLKQMQTAPQGLGRLKIYAQLLKNFPLVGIGGVDEAHMRDVLECGVGSVAVVRAVTQAPDYEAAIKVLNAYFPAS
jgi:thiamine-phosphate pyrophosphorylase